MADSHSTATAEATKATSTAHPPVQDMMNLAAEMESDRSSIVGARMMRAIGGGSLDAPPERFAGALGQMSGAAQAGVMQRLQRSYGNSYVGRVIQAKLTVGQPGDVYEQEADQIADQVMRMPDRLSSNHELSFSSVHASTAQRKCTACEEEKLQRKESPSTGLTPATVPPAVYEVLSSPGQPLGTTERAFMEPRFGQDFSDVRIHTGAKAAESAATVQARAYTVGNNIVFSDKESPSDLPVLAHELVHVIQQSSFLQKKIQKQSIHNPLFPCHETSLLPGGLDYFGTLAHLAIQQHYVSEIDGLAATEYAIPGSSETGATGRADIVDSTGGIYEIKPLGLVNEAFSEATNYLLYAERNCDPHVNWHLGTLYFPSREPVNENFSIFSWLNGPGVIAYTRTRVPRQPPEEEQQREREPKDSEPGPSDTLPEQLLKRGRELAEALAVEGLLDAALALGSALTAVVLSPLVGLAALVLGIAYFWDQIVAGVKKLAEGIKWVAGQVVGGVKKLAGGIKWVGHKIASAAESVWDWAFGSDVESVPPPVIDIPVTEEPMHCGMVAHEDTIVKIGADLLFPFNEWRLKPEADNPLKEAAVKIIPMLQKDDRIRIEGYTDIIGSDEYNQHLSEQRARAVALWFVEHGVIPMSRIHIEGYGRTRAQAKYNDEAGREQDRRVEIWVPKHGLVEKVCW